jgi:hypothetical protein
MRLNVAMGDLDIQGQNELYYSDELRKKLDMYFNEKLKDKNSNFNSYYSKKDETLYLNFNIYMSGTIFDSIDIVFKINEK